MHIRIYLDDLRPCPEGWIIARNVGDAQDIIRAHQGTYDISFDHDLGDGQDDSVRLIPWIMEHGRYPVDTYIHTANPVGRKNLTHDIAFMRRYQERVS